MLVLEDTGQAFEFYRSFLEWYARWYHPRYLEIGCNRGDTCWRLYEHCVSIDAVDVDYYADWEAHVDKFPNLHFYKAKSFDFFTKYIPIDKQYDLIFIDSDHSAAQVYEDITFSLAHLAEDGLIVLHDTYPPTLSHTGPAACGTAYQAIEQIRAGASSAFEMFTFPVSLGVTLLAPKLVMPWLKEKQQAIEAGVW
jgi:hypothetical protein